MADRPDQGRQEGPSGGIGAGRLASARLSRGARRTTHVGQ